MSTTNPFEDPDAQYLVLVNEEAQHSLWPTFAEVPAGWTVALPASGRQECLDYIEANWTDMRPKSLADAMADAATGHADATTDAAADTATDAVAVAAKR